MGCDQNADEIGMLPLAIHAGAFLRFILADVGYGLDNGFILVTDDDTQARQFVMEYAKETESKDCLIARWQKRRTYPKNYNCGFLMMRKAITAEEVEDFLGEHDFLPIIMCGGIFPECLKSGHYIFRLSKSDVKFLKSQKFSEQTQCFRRYVKYNIREVCKVLEELKSSIAIMEYRGSEEQREIYNYFMAVGSVFVAFLRTYQVERTSIEFQKVYKRVILRYLSRMQEFADGEILEEMLMSLVWEYLYQNNNVVVANLREMNMQVDEAIKTQKVILFDENYYYFSRELLMKICTPLLNTTSETELKRRLRAEGIIFCNSADYTVKKGIVNMDGVTVRPRFFWVNKEALLSPDNLCLEDMFCQENREENE